MVLDREDEGSLKVGLSREDAFLGQRGMQALM